jgi:hypothetical protein
MAIVKAPDREYRLGEKNLPLLGQRVVSWPWGNTPNLSQWASGQLKYPLGTIIYDVVDGFPVIAQIQTHDTYGAHPEWGVKLHRGTSVFVPVEIDTATGKAVAIKDPPEGWGVSVMAGWRDRERLGIRWRDISRVEGRSEWREHVTGVPKLVIVAGTTLLGALISPIGAIIGFVAGLVVDNELRGGDVFPRSREMWIHGDGDTPKRIIPSKVIHPLAGMVRHQFTRPGVSPPLAPDEYAFGQVFGFTADELSGDGLIGMSVRGFADQLRFGEDKDLRSYTPGAGILPPGSGNPNMPPIDSPLTAGETAFAHRVIGLTPAELGADRRKSLFVRGFGDQLLAHYGSNVSLDQFSAGAGQTHGGANSPPVGGKHQGGINIDLSHVDWGSIAQGVAPALALIPGVGVVAAGAVEAAATAYKAGQKAGVKL